MKKYRIWRNGPETKPSHSAILRILGKGKWIDHANPLVDFIEYSIIKQLGIMHVLELVFQFLLLGDVFQYDEKAGDAGFYGNGQNIGHKLLSAKGNGDAGRFFFPA